MRTHLHLLPVALGLSMLGCGGSDPSPMLSVDGGVRDQAGMPPSDLAGLDLAGLDLASVDLAQDEVTDGSMHQGSQDLSNDSGVTPMPPGLMVTWQKGCWASDSGHKYQAISFQMTTPMPLPLEGSLYFKPNCDPSGGIDNLNDNGGTIGSGGWLFWFIHHPDITMSSAKWWVGNQYSVCINYDGAPDC